MRELVSNITKLFRKEAPMRPNINRMVTCEWDYHTFPFVDRFVARSTPSEFTQLRRANSWVVRRAVAKYGREEDIDVLVHDQNSYVLIEVAKSSKCKGWHYNQLIHNLDDSVRLEVIKRTRSFDYELIDDESIYVRAEIARRTDDPHIALRLLNDPSEYVRSVIAERKFLPEFAF